MRVAREDNHLLLRSCVYIYIYMHIILTYSYFFSSLFSYLMLYLSLTICVTAGLGDLVYLSCWRCSACMHSESDTLAMGSGQCRAANQ